MQSHVNRTAAIADPGTTPIGLYDARHSFAARSQPMIVHDVERSHGSGPAAMFMRDTEETIR
ncbi:hypothetical protein PCAR4_210185 [Paraburkholderia caribensis]|nr:hypothetical protein PCAR4_210185 [Paraburkholderia caribensis]